MSDFELSASESVVSESYLDMNICYKQITKHIAYRRIVMLISEANSDDVDRVLSEIDKSIYEFSGSVNDLVKSAKTQSFSAANCPNSLIGFPLVNVYPCEDHSRIAMQVSDLEATKIGVNSAKKLIFGGQEFLIDPKNVNMHEDASQIVVLSESNFSEKCKEKSLKIVKKNIFIEKNSNLIDTTDAELYDMMHNTTNDDGFGDYKAVTYVSITGFFSQASLFETMQKLFTFSQKSIFVFQCYPKTAIPMPKKMPPKVHGTYSYETSLQADSDGAVWVKYIVKDGEVFMKSVEKKARFQ